VSKGPATYAYAGWTSSPRFLLIRSLLLSISAHNSGGRAARKSGSITSEAAGAAHGTCGLAWAWFNAWLNI